MIWRSTAVDLIPPRGRIHVEATDRGGWRSTRRSGILCGIRRRRGKCPHRGRQRRPEWRRRRPRIGGEKNAITRSRAAATVREAMGGGEMSGEGENTTAMLPPPTAASGDPDGGGPHRAVNEGLQACHFVETATWHHILRKPNLYEVCNNAPKFSFLFFSFTPQNDSRKGVRSPQSMQTLNLFEETFRHSYTLPVKRLSKLIRLSHCDCNIMPNNTIKPKMKLTKGIYMNLSRTRKCESRHIVCRA